jgi:hypothetical protein
MFSLFGIYEAYYFQRIFEIIPQEFLPGYGQALFHLSQPGVKQWWDGGGRDQFSDKFVESLEQAQGKPAG